MFYLYNAPRDHYIGPFGSDEKARAYQREPIPGVNASFEHVTSIVHIRDIPPGSKCSTPEHGPTDFWGNGFLL